MTTARRASGVDEKERRRHELKEQYKQFLRSTDHVAVAALWYPGGVCGLIVARETAVELLVQLMRSEGRAS